MPTEFYFSNLLILDEVWLVTHHFEILRLIHVWVHVYAF